MLRKLLLAVVFAGVVAAAVWLVRGGRGPSPAHTTTSAPTVAVEAYFYRGAALVPTVVHVPRTQAVATAALGALLAGPPHGLRTAIPAGVTLNRVTVAGGRATADFSSALAGVPRTAQAQIVYTLTQFASVRTAVIEAAGSPLGLADGSGRTLLRAATRHDYADLTPAALIFVAAPLRDSTVASPVRVAGTAVAFEATLALELRRGPTLLRTWSVTASAGAPERGTWATTLRLDPGRYRLLVYEPSAKDGSPLHETSVDFTVGR